MGSFGYIYEINLCFVPISIFITDDHPLAITGLMNMLLPYKHISVTGTFVSGAALLGGLQQAQPDILLLDILLPDTNGKELAQLITTTYPHIRIIAITSLDAPTHVKSMMRNGCKGFLLKNIDQSTLVEAIDTVYGGGEYIESSLKEQMLGNILNFRKRMETEGGERIKAPRLTNREKDVLDLIVKEYSNQEIADQLFLSIRTVERHRFNLMRKFDAKSPIGLLKSAIELGLV